MQHIHIYIQLGCMSESAEVYIFKCKCHRRKKTSTAFIVCGVFFPWGFFALVFVMCWGFFVYFGFFGGASEVGHWVGMLLFGLFSDILKKFL